MNSENNSTQATITLPEGWNVVKFGEVADILSGYAFKSNEFVDNGIPVIKIKNIEPPYVTINDVQYISKESAAEKGKYLLSYDDILISMTGSNITQMTSVVGKVGRVRVKRPLLLNQRVGKIYVINSSEYDQHFLYFYMSRDEVKYELASMAGGSANQANISPKQIKQLVLPNPPIEEQREISAILSSLDDKIELNITINKNLEDMAQALFKRWFVDYEFPNENGEPYKSSGGEFEESELGVIPKGWRAGTLSDLGEVVGGATPSKSKEEYYTPRGIPWITPKDLSINKNKYISRGQIDITDEGFKSSSTRIVPKGTVLFSSRAPIGYIAVSKNEMTTNQGFKSLIPFEHIGSEFLFYVLKFNTETIETRASGSTFKEISGSEMKRIPIIIPPFNVIKQFNIIVEPVGKMVEKCESESDSLIQLRDSLLPKLMSGEIRVPLKQDSLYTHSIELPLAADNNA